MADGQWGGTFDTRPIRVKVMFKLLQENCQTGFYLRRTGASFAALQDIADDVAEWAETSFRTLLMPADTLVGVDVVDIQSKDGALHPFVNLPGLQGDAAGALPSFCTVPVIMKSAKRARYGQGRMLWPIRQEGETFQNNITAAAVTRYQAVIDALGEKYMQGDITGSLQLINVHGPLAAGRGENPGSTAPAVPASWYDVTSIRLNTIVGSLRSRKTGIGS